MIKIGDCAITPSPTGRNIGVIFDQEMSTVSHVKHVCCTSYYHLKNIASIRSCLTQKTAVRFVYYLVISRIDYANCVQYDLIYKKCKTLPQMGTYHTSSREAVLASRGVSCKTWAGATDLLEQRASRVFRSTTNNYWYVPPSRSRYDDRMFSVAIPRLRNSLPNEIKKTCRLLTSKT